jgi:hypothetical protein
MKLVTIDLNDQTVLRPKKVRGPTLDAGFRPWERKPRRSNQPQHLALSLRLGPLRSALAVELGPESGGTGASRCAGDDVPYSRSVTSFRTRASPIARSSSWLSASAAKSSSARAGDTTGIPLRQSRSRESSSRTRCNDSPGRDLQLRPATVTCTSLAGDDANPHNAAAERWLMNDPDPHASTAESSSAPGSNTECPTT